MSVEDQFLFCISLFLTTMFLTQKVSITMVSLLSGLIIHTSKCCHIHFLHAFDALQNLLTLQIPLHSVTQTQSLQGYQLQLHQTSRKTHSRTSKCGVSRLALSCWFQLSGQPRQRCSSTAGGKSACSYHTNPTTKSS